MHVHYSSSKQDWETPPDLFDALDSEFGFDLDVCATRRNAKVADYLSPEDDALAPPWRGACYCNPPFDQITAFVTKAIRSAAEGATVVMLVPARTDSRWFHALLEYADDVRLLARRVKFVGAKEPAPFPCAVVVLRPSLRWASSDPRVAYSIRRRHKPGVNWTTLRVVRDAEA